MREILIVGIGNALWADESFGLRCVERLAARYAFPANVRIVDGGTERRYLLPHLETAGALLLFGAVDYGLRPGTLKILEGAEVTAFLGTSKISLHRTGFHDAIAASELMGMRPAELVLIGCQPEEREGFGGGLRDRDSVAIDTALAIALSRLRRWGVEARAGASASRDPAAPTIRRAAYGGGRLTQAQARRSGGGGWLPRAEP